MIRPIGHARRLIAVAAALAAGMVGSACGGDSDKGNALPQGASRSFDLYLGEQMGLIDYAILKSRNRCLAEAGFPQNLNSMPAKPTRAFPSLVITAASFGYTSEQEARRRGFGRDEQAQPPHVVSFDPNYDTTLTRCEAAAWDKLGRQAQDTYKAYFQLGNDLLGGVAEVQRTVDDDLTPKLLDCMEGKGYRVPDRQQYLKKPTMSAWGVPFGRVEGAAPPPWKPDRTKRTVQVAPAMPGRKYVPTPQESQFAAAMFQCNQDIGRIERCLEAAQKVQQNLVAKHETTLAELNPQIEKLARTAATIAEAA